MTLLAPAACASYCCDVLSDHCDLPVSHMWGGVDLGVRSRVFDRFMVRFRPFASSYIQGENGRYLGFCD